MNSATRLTLTVGLVVALSGGTALADAAGDYESIFGDEDKKVIASRTKTDDVKFAAKLFKAAKDMPDSPGLQVLLYEKAVKFGSTGTAGCDTALAALKLLEEAVPAKKAHWLQRKFEVVKFRFDRSYGAARKAAGEPYMDMLETLADARVAEGKGTEAKTLYNRALMVANYIKSPRLAEILAKSKRANAVVAQQARLKSLRAKLTADPKDTAVRRELVVLYVVALDNPAEAARLLTDDLDEVTRTYVPLAAKKLESLDEAICLELGEWYYRTLSKKASAAGRAVVLRRAQGYYQRFLESHAKKDAQSYRAKAALESIEKELKKLGAPAVAGGRTLMLNLARGVTMKLVRIPAGKAVLGSPKSEKGRGYGEQQHAVVIPKAFYMGATEVTVGQFTAFTGATGYKAFSEKHNSATIYTGTWQMVSGASWRKPGFKQTPGHPAVCINWVDAVAFCKWAGKKTDRPVRMPTEAEWEYACRAGTTTRFCSGNDEKTLGSYAWYKDNGGNASHPVARKKPNKWGLYDMHGNVSEWCPRKLRGGGWGSRPDQIRSAYRRDAQSHWRAANMGFRVVVGPAAPAPSSSK
ncbi:MAG: SUMF1/EgtB/PvdO family nonheme iron enzyme [Phycisphaerae bacterium]|jgi:formylglycine-generating enzyme required for sulfatase activity|nr:SUMF1/EgtB/PvdO family nonheme iron enzyme [Phycisphaerae bacterium]